MRHTIHLRDPQIGHRSYVNLWAEIKPWLLAGYGIEVEVRKARRSTEQNARMWAMLSDVSRQVDWYGQKLSAEEWKHVFSASLKRQKVVPGLDGGFVVLGQSTSQMSKAELGELMDLIEAFGAQKGVRFTAPEYLEEE